jgi:hypothetical protein
LVPVRNAGAVAKAVVALLSAEARAPLAQALAVHAAAHFSEDHVLQQHLAVYRELAELT